jgi:predicted Zn-dependent peptidase
MITRHELSNGVRVLCERMEQSRSVAVGAWVGAGSRFEGEANNGVSHFIEHMLFKGTETRTAKQIAAEIDAIGGQLNAFTSKDCTCFYARTMDRHVGVGVGILADILQHSQLASQDVDLERNVILEEINMYEDAPEDLVHDLLAEAVWRESPLGRPILGTPASLARVGAGEMRAYMRGLYGPSNTVLAVAGSFDEGEMLGLLEREFAPLGGAGGPGAPGCDEPLYHAEAYARPKDTEQVHLCLGLPGVPLGDDDVYALQLANYVFGGGMSSVLFQKIREELGLVYSIYSYLSSYRNAGLFTVYAGMQKPNAERVLGMVLDEARAFRERGLTEDLLAKAKEQFKGNYVMGLEGVGSRMNNIGKSETLLGYVLEEPEVEAKVDAVTLDKAYEVVRRVFDLDGRLSACAMGPVGGAFEASLRGACGGRASPLPASGGAGDPGALPGASPGASPGVTTGAPMGMSPGMSPGVTPGSA